MSLVIRPSARDDFPGIVAVLNAANPDYPVTVDEYLHQEDTRDPTCLQARFVAEKDNRIVGYAMYGQWMSMYHPRKFFVEVTVHPELQGQRIGARLYDRLLEELRQHRPLAIRVGGVREDMARGLRFLADRGFREEMRFWESRLDLPSFDPAPYQGVEEKVRAQGIEIRTLRELQADEAWERKLFDMVVEIERDVPQPEAYTPSSFEHFVASHLTSPDLLPDGWFVALEGGTFVGESNLWRSQAMPDVQVGLTGVRRAYRRRGIALALKIRAITWAKAQGYPVMRTGNESNNRPMLAINERLGFVKQPAWISFVKEFPDSG